MDKLLKQALLYDFYGELLTDHQKEIYGEAVNDDLSVSEIAASHNISRQAASDLIKRINRILEDYEDKLKLVERFVNIRQIIIENESIPEDVKESILKEL